MSQPLHPFERPWSNWDIMADGPLLDEVAFGNLYANHGEAVDDRPLENVVWTMRGRDRMLSQRQDHPATSPWSSQPLDRPITAHPTTGPSSGEPSKSHFQSSSPWSVSSSRSSPTLYRSTDSHPISRERQSATTTSSGVSSPIGPGGRAPSPFDDIATGGAWMSSSPSSGMSRSNSKHRSSLQFNLPGTSPEEGMSPQNRRRWSSDWFFRSPRASADAALGPSAVDDLWDDSLSTSVASLALDLSETAYDGPLSMEFLGQSKRLSK